MFKFAQFFDMKRSETELMQTGAMGAGSRIFVSFGPFVPFRETSRLQGALRRPRFRHHKYCISHHIQRQHFPLRPEQLSTNGHKWTHSPLKSDSRRFWGLEHFSARRQTRPRFNHAQPRGKRHAPAVCRFIGGFLRLAEVKIGQQL
jgi:hypothetical protein